MIKEDLAVLSRNEYPQHNFTNFCGIDSHSLPTAIPLGILRRKPGSKVPHHRKAAWDQFNWAANAKGRPSCRCWRHMCWRANESQTLIFSLD